MEPEGPAERRLSFPSLVDAARQQTELVCWVAKSLQDHEGRLEALAAQLAQLTRPASRRHSGVASAAASAAAASLLSAGGDGAFSRPATQLADVDEEDSEHGPPSLGLAEGELAASSPGTYFELPAAASAQSGRELAGSARSGRELAGSEGDASEAQELEAPPQPEARELRPSVGDEGLEMVGRRLSSASSALAQDLELSSQAMRRSSVVRRSSFDAGPAELPAVPSSGSRSSVGPVQAQGAQTSKGGEAQMSAYLKVDERLQAMEDLLRQSLEEVMARLLPLEGRLEPLERRLEPLEEFRRRLEPLEAALAERLDPAKEVKELRLQTADISMDLQALQENVQQLSQAMEALEERPDMQYLDGAREGLSVLSTEAGMSSSASRRTSAASVRKPSGLGSLGGRGAHPRPPPSQASQLPPPAGGAQELLEDLSCRLESLEAEKAHTEQEDNRLDLAAKLAALDERLLGLDSSYRGTIKVVQSKLEMLMLAEQHRNEDDANCSKTWNLANQVDVIQSVVLQEMAYVRADLLRAVRQELGPQAPETRPPLPRAVGRASMLSEDGRSPRQQQPQQQQDVGVDQRDLEEKVKRLQDCYQQCTLKLAGLKSANQHADQQAALATDRVKKLSEDLEHLTEQASRSEARLDRLAPPSPNMAPEHGPGEAEPSASPRSGGPGRRSRPRALGMPKSPAASEQLPKSPAAGEQQLPKSPAAGEKRPSDMGGEAGGPGLAKSPAEDGDSTTSRILRLGKKVTNLDGEVHQDLKSLREDLELASQRLGMLTSFLPRRQRRLVERILATGKGKDEEGEEGGKGKEAAETGAKRVQFSEKLSETRTYEVTEDDNQLPWQAVGEPEQKWFWCYRGLNEMGRPLASHLELLEHERLHFEQEVAESLDRIQEQLKSAGPRRGKASAATDEDGEADADYMTPEGMERLSRRVEKSVLPQLAAVEDRVERLANDLRDTKRAQDKDRNEKVGKDEFQLMAMRVAVFDAFDPKELQAKLEELGSRCGDLARRLDELSADQKRAEANSVHRNDLTKVKSEQAALKGDHQKLQTNVNELSAQIFGANRQLSQMVTDAKGNFERAVTKLEKEKATMWEYANMSERVSKLEGSMRDNRQILSGPGAQEVNTFVKRIILNMEDKIMVLEKKVDCLAEGKPLDATAVPVTEVQPIAEAPKEQVQVLGGELAAISQAVTQLKQEIYLSKVDMDHILEQGQLHADLAQRLNVYVERASSEEASGEAGAALNMSRVQVMVAAAARQLVAGSKWVTKEAFDARLAEVRKEQLAASRQLQAQLEDVGGQVAKALPLSGGAPPGPKLPKMLVKRQLPEGSPDGLDWPPALPGDPSAEKQGSRFQSKDRPPGSAPAAAGAGAGRRPPSQRRPLTERGSVRERPET